MNNIKSLSYLFAILIFLFACSGEKKKERKKLIDTDISINSPEYKRMQISIVSEQIEETPNIARNYDNRAKLYLELENYDSALADASRAIQLDSTNEYYYFTQSKAYKGLQRIGEAFLAAKNAENRFIKSPDFYSYLGKLYFISQDYGASIHYLDLAEDLAPFHTETFFIKGLIYLELGDTIKGIKFLELAIEQVPDDTDIFNVMASVYNAMRQPEMAIEYLKTGLRMSTKDPFLHYNMGVTMLDMGMPDSAKFYFAMSTRVDSTFYLGHYNMGVLSFAEENCEETIEFMTRATKFKEDVERAHAYLGYCLEKLGYHLEALDAFKKALEKEPENQSLKAAKDRVQQKIDFERQSS
ncbi:tetratricopeptide repeat protein [Hyphobacterium sp. CCMP332]|nr:tetratricopeptide repeat protein [Hyphobacterium sp. CCMP332]